MLGGKLAVGATNGYLVTNNMPLGRSERKVKTCSRRVPPEVVDEVPENRPGRSSLRQEKPY